jgi:RNase P subunit RPR2
MKSYNSLEHLLKKDEVTEYLDLREKMSYLSCPTCRSPLKQSSGHEITIDTEKGPKTISTSVDHCPKCGFIAEINPETK